MCRRSSTRSAIRCSSSSPIGSLKQRPTRVATLKRASAARQRGERVSFALIEPGNLDVLLGGASLNDMHQASRKAAIRYWLAPHARGRGVATHAVRVLAEWPLADLDVARFELMCGPDNAVSQHVAERCGFITESVLRSHIPFKGGRRDTVLFSLLPEELRSRSCPASHRSIPRSDYPCAPDSPPGARRRG